MDAFIVSTFAALLAHFSECFTAPSFETFKVIVQGWILCRGRRTITRVLSAGDGLGRRSFEAYHRFFSRARWSLDELGHVVFRLALKLLPKDAPLLIAVDDTLTHKSGKRIWGAAMHHDPLRSTGRRKEFSFGHNWVVLTLHVPLPFLGGRGLALPILMRLYRKRVKRGRRPAEQKSTGGATAAEYRTRPQLAMEMVALLASWVPDRTIDLVGDTEYGGKSVSRHLPGNVHLTSRMNMRARLFPRPDSSKPTRGRPRKLGEQLPSPVKLAKSRKVRWKKTEVPIYGQQVEIHYKLIHAMWYSSAGERMLTIVVVRDPSGRRKDDCFFTTRPDATPEEILERIAARWPIEVTFHDAKQCLGLEDPQNRVAKATPRTAPMALFAYSLVVIWYAQHGAFDLKSYHESHPWYRHKRLPSFEDMLDFLRAHIHGERLSADPSRHAGSRKVARPARAAGNHEKRSAG